MSKKSEPIGGEPSEQESSTVSQALIRRLWGKIRTDRMKAESYADPDLKKGFSIQEQLDALTEKYGEEVIAELEKELAKPKKEQSDVHKPSRTLEGVALVTEPKTGNSYFESIWQTDAGTQHIPDAGFIVFDTETLAKIQAAPADAQGKICEFLKNLRQKMIYPETGNDIQPIFIVRNNPKTGYSVFLHYPLQDGAYESDVTQRIPKNIKESLKSMNNGNVNELLQRWIRTDENAKRIKETIVTFFVSDARKKDTAIDTLIAGLPSPTSKAEGKATSSSDPAPEQKKPWQEQHEKSYQAAQEAFDKAKKEAEEKKKGAAPDDEAKKAEAKAERKRKAEEEAARMRADAEEATRRAEAAKKTAEKEEKRKAAEETKQQEEEKRKTEEETQKKTEEKKRADEARKKAEEDAAKTETEKKEQQAKERARKKIEQLITSGTDAEIEKFLNRIRGFIGHAETNANLSERENAKIKFSIAAGEDYTPENVARYKTETPYQWRQRKIAEQKAQASGETARKKAEEEARRKTAEEARKREEERQKAEEKRKAAEETKQQEEEKRKTEEETQKKTEEKKRADEARKQAEEAAKSKTTGKKSRTKTAEGEPKGTEAGAPPPPPPEDPEGGSEIPKGSEEPGLEGEAKLPPEEGLTRLERLGLGLQGVAKIAFGTVMTLTGLRVFQAALPLVQDFIRRREAGKQKEALFTILSEIEGAYEKADAAKSKEGVKETPKEEAERIEREVEIKEKKDALQERIDTLVREKIINPEKAGQFRAELNAILINARATKEGITQKTERQIAQTLYAYVIKKTDKKALFELGKQGLNFGLLITGLQTIRALTYAGLSVYQRTQRRLAENERLIQEGKAREIQSVWRDLTQTAPQELWQGVIDAKDITVDLLMKNRVSQAEWTTQTQSAGRALGNIAVSLGLVGLTWAEMQSTGGIEAQIDHLQHDWDIKGVHTLWDNWTLNLDRLSFGLSHKLFGEHGAPVSGTLEQPVTHPHQEQPAEQPQSKPEQLERQPIEQPPTEHQPHTREEFERENPLLFKQHGTAPHATEQTYAQSATAYQQQPEVVKVEINYASAEQVQAPIHAEVSFGEHGNYQHLDQFLRRLAVQSMDTHSLHGHGTFDHIDAARVENVVANIRNALLERGDTVLAPGASSLQGIAHLEGHALVIDDYREFLKLSHALFGHAEQTITEQSGAVHYIDNTAHAVWQKMWDVKMQNHHQHVPVEDFSRFHHVELPPHIPIHHYEAAPVVAPPSPIIGGETPPHLDASESVGVVTPDATGGASILSTQTIPGLTHNLVIQEMKPASGSSEATPSAVPHPPIGGAESTSASAQASTSAEPKVETSAHTASHAETLHWTANDFFQKFSEAKFTDDFFTAAHNNPDSFTMAFMEQLVQLRKLYGADYYAKLIPDYIHDAAGDAQFKINISEFINGVLLHKKDAIHINFGSTKAEFSAH